ncbi:glycoside hydrolase family 130 protein [Paraflavitalea pollutisoli]|uniref:glycoside hydrolase family 130 protein n=1 Tax=Paraflavitalea pollutisoli TaxID=3034143 RepID=UPI0023EC7FB0|nr:glycoside hydrolase family 130 protein [Paraflavitalea sp. H1-2-19X]
MRLPVVQRIVCLAAALITLTAVQAQQPTWPLGPFVRPQNVNPVIAPDSNSRFNCPMNGKPVDWESNDTFNPAAIAKGDSLYVLYRAEDKYGIGIGFRTSRLGLAATADGLHFTRRPTPVLYPADDSQKEFEWPGGCEDPRIAVTEDGLYVMLYTQWNRKVPRIGVATSRDLVNWTKHGPAFKKYGGKYFDVPSKSASLLTTLKNGRLVITKLNGKYQIFWGEYQVNMATSDDLINWTPVVDEGGNLKPVIKTRRGYFDSDLTECGPPAVLTKEGIILLYNGKNGRGEKSDPAYTPNSYCAGQVLLDAKDPFTVKARLDKPFLIPSEPFEKSGQYPSGTVFIEGLVYYKKQWFLYYGCADSRVAVAVYDPKQSVK